MDSKRVYRGGRRTRYQNETSDSLHLETGKLLSRFPQHTADVIALQRVIGNRAAQRVLRAPAAPMIQRKRLTQPVGLSDNYSSWVKQSVSEDIYTITSNEELSGEIRDAQVWQLLGQKFTTAEQKGAGYLAQLTDAIQSFRGLKGDGVAEQQHNQQQFIESNQQKRQGYDDIYSKHYETVYEDSNNRMNAHTMGYKSDDKAQHEPPEDLEDYAYNNEIHETGEGQFYVEADANYAELDKARKVGKRLPNSEIFWQQLQGHLTQNKGMQPHEVLQAQKAMPYLQRHSISNEETMAVIYMCLPDGAELDTTQSFAAGTPEFNALLGTENGRAAMFMAKDHLDQIERTITHVEVYINEMGGFLRFHFGDAP